MSCPSPRKLAAITVAAVLSSIGLSSCVFVPALYYGPATAPVANSDPGPVDDEAEPTANILPTDTCLVAMKEADEGQQHLYDTHPFFDDDIDTSTQEGADELNQHYEDFDRQWDLVMEPLFVACSSPDDFWAALQVYPEVGGATSREFLYAEQVDAWCIDRNDHPPMCEGWDTWEPSL